ncbi:two-component sensor histidine kinase [Azospirillum sp. B510]|uniref:PAS domain-containing sensor histidine kinase n=1 Tax=Azospirillum sp. (strain B510) TaxID=137722 RepID=UPI0001C4C094|nr:PAS domain-containing sensor histidine kinase [Azospirillum sp. B510]BAI72904.1 two-component sensor histidine kinase [Azospirillum sp. B510]
MDKLTEQPIPPPQSVEEALENAHRYRASLIETMPGLIVHRGGRVLYCNTALANLLGYPTTREISALTHVLSLVPEDALQAEEKAYARCLNGELRLEARRVKRYRADSSLQWFDQLLETVDWVDGPAIMEMLTRMRHHPANADLPRQGQLLQAAIDAMPNGVLMLDKDLHLEGANSEYFRLWDYPPGMFPPGTPVSATLDYNHSRGDYGDVPRKETVEALSARLRVKGVANAEREVPNGRILDIRTAPRADGGYVITQYDITDRKRIETELREAKERAESILQELRETQQQLIVQEKMASLGQLTAGIAHELKNPLNFVNNFSDLSEELFDELLEFLNPVKSGLPSDAVEEVDSLIKDLQSNLRKIGEHGRRADRIVKSMLDHSRGGGGEWQSVDLNGLVEEALVLSYQASRTQDSGFNATLERKLDPELGELDLVPQDISRVLVNLFTNAFYALRRRQIVGADPAYRPTLTVTTRGCNDDVEIRITDNGTGVPPALIEKIFTPFFTTKPAGEGTGLGLSLSYDIVVHQHRGRFDVSSVENEFSEFVISLPRKAVAVDSGERRKR